MINLFLAPIQKAISTLQRTLTLLIANWPLTLTALVLGLSFEEVLHGFRILRWLALI